MIAICIGHSRPGDRGAVSVGRLTEWEYNRILGGLMLARLRSLEIPAMLVDEYDGASYGSAMRWLGGYLLGQQATCAVELHFNASSNEAANGHEGLYWHSSMDGLRLATALEKAQNRAFPGQRRRGLIPVTNRAMRGGGFLAATHCPAVIWEPFFGSNADEWEMMSTKQCILADALVAGLERYTLNHSAS